MGPLIPDWAWPIAVLTAIGGLIDFLLGQSGRRLVLEFLEDWWIRFDSVTRENFSKQEAKIAISIFDLCFGKALFSIKRFVSVASIFSVLVTYNIAGFIFEAPKDVTIFYIHLLVPENPLIALSIIGFSISISITRNISEVLMNIPQNYMITNFACLLLLISISYGFLVVWPPIMQDIVWFVGYWILWGRGSGMDIMDRTIMGMQIAIYTFEFPVSPNDLVGRLFNVITPTYWVPPDDRIFDPIFRNTAEQMSYFVNLFRFIIVLLFIMSFMVRIIVGRSLSLVWLRIIESDKPIFALVCGGITAAVIFITQVVQHI